MENITFYEQINLFLENKRPRKLPACVCRPKFVHASLRHAYAVTEYHTQLGFPKPMKDKYSALKADVWNESHIVWEPLQTLIFLLYKAIHDTFSKHIENPKGKPKIH